jgi:hypothetical protein
MSILDTLSKQFVNAAAPNRFEIIINFPSAIGGDTNAAKFMCKAGSIPSESIGEITMGYQSQTLKLSGDRTYDDWTCTVYNTEEWAVRNDIEKWMKIINDPETNFKTSHGSYQGDVVIHQLSINDLSIVAGYKLMGAWPKSVGDISLDWETNDEKETFDITWSYLYFVRL